MKLLKTNTNKYKSNFKKYFEQMLQGYDNDYCNTIDKLLLCFNSEVNNDYNKHRLPNLQQRIADYLSGLPYGFYLAYEHEILDFACLVHELKEIPCNKVQIIKNNIYNHCAIMMLKLGNKEIIKDLY